MAQSGSIARRCGIRDNGYLVGSVIVAFAVGAGGGMWLKTHLDAQAVAKVAQEQKQEQPKSKYDTGPVDAQEMPELANKERVKVGVVPLKIDERLNASAQEKANDMQALTMDMNRQTALRASLSYSGTCQTSASMPVRI